MSGASGRCGSTSTVRAEAAQGLDERVPLRHRQRGIGLDGGVHERVDDVVDAEVRRLDHDVVTTPGERTGHDHLHRLSDNLTILSVADSAGPRKMRHAASLADLSGQPRAHAQRPAQHPAPCRPPRGSRACTSSSRPPSTGSPQELRRAVFEGELESGTPLREVALAESLGVSRPTVREALTMLVAEGLATREPHRGVAVATPEAGSVRDVVAARWVLEGAGVRRWSEATDDQRARVRVGAGRLHRGGARRAPPTRSSTSATSPSTSPWSA